MTRRSRKKNQLGAESAINNSTDQIHTSPTIEKLQSMFPSIPRENLIMLLGLYSYNTQLVIDHILAFSQHDLSVIAEPKAEQKKSKENIKFVNEKTSKQGNTSINDLYKVNCQYELEQKRGENEWHRFAYQRLYDAGNNQFLHIVQRTRFTKVNKGYGETHQQLTRQRTLKIDRNTFRDQKIDEQVEAVKDNITVQ